MNPSRHYYLIQLQYLGFRYSGWQKQPDVLTVERMVSRTLCYVLEHKNFKLLASGRTDAKVSANMAYVELFLDGKPLKIDHFLPKFNENLPPDIRAVEIREVDAVFNIINAPLRKEYLYLFSYGIKAHPFAAPFMTTILTNLDIATMKQAAKLFEGTHDFKNYAYKPNPETKTVGIVTRSEIIENELYSANFFPEKSYMFRIQGKGFKRHQIRLMMGMLFDIGHGKEDLDFLKQTLQPGNSMKLEYIAPASGLILNEVILTE
jgi:tRNA pseudouridine38-40 synthase